MGFRGDNLLRFVSLFLFAITNVAVAAKPVFASKFDFEFCPTAVVASGIVVGHDELTANLTRDHIHILISDLQRNPDSISLKSIRVTSAMPQSKRESVTMALLLLERLTQFESDMSSAMEMAAAHNEISDWPYRAPIIFAHEDSELVARLRLGNIQTTAEQRESLEQKLQAMLETGQIPGFFVPWLNEHRELAARMYTAPSVIYYRLIEHLHRAYALPPVATQVNPVHGQPTRIGQG